MHIIIVGCGRMGAGLAHTLQQREHSITVMDRDPIALERLKSTFTGQTVLGIGFDRDMLLLAGIERADALAAVSDSDETNAVTARIARQVFQVPRVVARLYDPHKADIYRRLGLQTISTTRWGINRIAELLCYSHLEAIKSLGSGEVDLIEEEVSPFWVGRAVRDVSIPGELQVIAISRAGTTFLPTMGTLFQTGDHMHLAVLATSIDRLKKLLSQG